MLTITSPEEIQAYRASKALNQSELKKIEHGLAHYKILKDNPTPPSEGMLLGSIVDTLLLGPEGEADRQFHVVLGEMPSESVRHVLERVAERVESDSLQENQDELLSAIQAYAWQPGWKQETRVAKMLEQGAEYFEEMMRGKGKTVVSAELYLRALKVVDMLKLYHSELLDRERLQRDDSIKVVFQKPIFFEVHDVPCKALIDIWIERERNGKRTVRIIDLKTTRAMTSEFDEVALKYRYDLQMAFYREAAIFGEGLHNDDISVEFLVESTTEPGSPRHYVCSKQYVDRARFHLSDKRPGLELLMARWKAYQGNGFTQEVESITKWRMLDIE